MGVTVVKDNVSKKFGAITALVRKQVLVGIPEANADRTDESPMNNAAIGYVQEFGSPATNVPARPFLIPGVKKAEKPALVQLRKAMEATIDGDPKKADQYLNAAGIIGANEARGEINSNIPPPLSPQTIANRHRNRGTKRRENEQGYLDLVKKGIEPGAAQTEAGIIALIDTGSLRKSITHVVRDK